MSRDRPRDRNRRPPGRVALVIATAYLLVGALWVAILERALPGLVPSPELHAALQSIGLWGFVFGTGIALFFVIRLELRRRNRESVLLQRDFDRLRDHLQATPLAWIGWDRDLSVTEWSARATELFGWTAEEAVGKSASDWELLHPADREAFERTLAGMRLKERDGALTVHRNSSSSGGLIWCEWYTSWVRFGKNGKGSFISLVRDVSPERRQMEQVQNLNRDLELRAARRTHELAVATRELTAFTNSISHDLRSPVRSMIGFAERLRDRFADELSGEARSQLVYLLAAGHQLDHLIQDLGEYAQLGTASVDMRPVDLVETARAALQDLEATFPEAPSVVTLPRSTLTLRADAELLRRVLANVIENALKYRDVRRPPRVTIEAERAGSEVKVRIRDNGVGIPPEHRETVFRLFSRLHAQEAHGGSGMGLAVVRRAMELMGGSVAVSEHSGPGTTFLLRFPSAGSVAEAVSTGARRSEDGQRPGAGSGTSKISSASSP
jgi:PAS domain S-box-containing protein